jgi:hypothetical protein
LPVSADWLQRRVPAYRPASCQDEAHAPSNCAAQSGVAKAEQPPLGVVRMASTASTHLSWTDPPRSLGIQGALARAACVARQEAIHAPECLQPTGKQATNQPADQPAQAAPAHPPNVLRKTGTACATAATPARRPDGGLIRGCAAAISRSSPSAARPALPATPPGLDGPAPRATAATVQLAGRRSTDHPPHRHATAGA